MKTAILVLLITFASLFGLSVESGSSYAADATSCVTIDNYSFVNKCAESIKLRWKNQFGNCTTKGCSKQIDPGNTYAIQGYGKVNYDACFLTPGKSCLEVRGDVADSDNIPMLPDQPAGNKGQSDIKKKNAVCLTQVQQCQSICGEVNDLGVRIKCAAACTDQKKACGAQ